MNLQSTFNHHLMTILPTSVRRLVIGFSGGLDSMVLLHLVAKYKQDISDIDVIAVHVNHQLSTHADEWENHCRDITSALSIEFFPVSVQVNTGARISLEASAREARYSALRDFVTTGDMVLTGHHADDQVETLLLQLKRGAGLPGLSAMPEFRSLTDSVMLCRPLLGMSRQTLTDYAEQHALQWIHDESNDDTSYDRNFLRHDVLPLLTNRWPGFVAAATRSSAIIAEQQALIDEYTKQDVAICIVGERLSIVELLKFSQVRQKNIIRMWLKQQVISMPSAAVLNDLLHQLSTVDSDSGLMIDWGQTAVIRSHRKQLVLVGKVESVKNVVLPIAVGQTVRLPDSLGHYQLNGTEMDHTESKEKNSVQALKLPKKWLDTLEVRFDGSGSRMSVVGRKGSKKINDWLKSLDVAPWERTRIPLLFSGGQCIAIGDTLIADIPLTEPFIQCSVCWSKLPL